MIAIREKEREKRKVGAEAKKREKLADQIAKFRRGEYVYLWDLTHEVLRIDGDKVVTSRRAEVPLSHAVKLYRAIMAGKDVVGARVGHFTVNSVIPFGDDTAVRIGCHNILLSEAAKVLGTRIVEVA